MSSLVVILAGSGSTCEICPPTLVGLCLWCKANRAARIPSTSPGTEGVFRIARSSEFHRPHTLHPHRPRLVAVVVCSIPRVNPLLLALTGRHKELGVFSSLEIALSGRGDFYSP